MPHSGKGHTSSSRFLFVLTLLSFPIIAFSAFFPRFLHSTNAFSNKAIISSSEDVLGSYSYRDTPRIYISATESGFTSGGLISLSSTEEPAVTIDGYKITEDAQIDMYKANVDAVLAYLTHDDHGKQTKAAPDISKLEYVTQVKTAVDTGQGTKITLPLTDSGIWYLKVFVNGVTAHAFVVRSESGALVKEGNNEFIFWGQNFKTRRSVSDGIVTVYNLQNTGKVLSTTSFNAEGIAKAPLTDLSDIAVVRRNDDIAIIPINLTYLNTGYSYRSFAKKPNVTRYFIFTDRPLYRPGDTVYFKAVLRDDDDARYSIPGGIVNAQVWHGYDQKKPLFEKALSVSSDGTINGEYTIPKDGDTGYYSLTLSREGASTGNSGYYDYYNYQSDTNSSEYSDSYTSFDVEYFKKPEFFIDVTTEKTHVIAGDNASFTISGQYFSGQPLANQTVSYSVETSNFYEYDYLAGYQYEAESFDSEYRYWDWYGKTSVAKGSVKLDENGRAEIPLDTRIKEQEGRKQVYSISATLEDGSQTPSFASRNVLVSAGEYSIYRNDYGWGTKVGEGYDLPLTLLANKENAKIGGVALSAKVHREEWISYQEPDKKYWSYRKEEEDLPNIKVTTDSNGKAKISFTPQKKGSYTIEVAGQDSRGNIVSKTFYTWATEDYQPYFYSESQSSISIISDKKEYEPGNTATLTISSQVPDRDLFVTFERGRTDRYEILHMNGKKANLTTSINSTDMPNMYVVASSFSSFGYDTNGTNLVVSPLEKKLLVQITPDRGTYGPSDTVSVNISTTDAKGDPVTADVALWAVDKAIFELSDNKLGNIFKEFWNQRINSTLDAHSLQGILVYNAEQGGGCFAKGTKILMADGSVKNIEDIRGGDYIATRSSTNDELVFAKVTKTMSASEDSSLILNGSLHVTADHIIRVNDTWKEAGSAQVGDFLTLSTGQHSPVTSIEWLLGKTDVYNLEVENEHTFIADGVWVHNQKGDLRNTFKDTAYWNPSIHTDSSGRAKISFKLPDNLTTWAFAAVASTTDTKVGQTTTEIIVSKDVIVRPILPNILRVGDTARIAALIQNFTDGPLTLDTRLTFNAGTVANATDTQVILNSKETRRVFWTVTPDKEDEKAKFTFEAVAKENKKQADIIETTLPVKAFGFEERQAESGVGNKTYTLTVHNDSDPLKSSVVVSLASSMLGTLPTAIAYLIQYPYGCIEQTTSRFVPAVIAKANKDLFANALKDKKLDDMIAKGIERLEVLQQSDGGWGWWSTQNSDPFISAYVTEYVLEAKKLGVDTGDLIDRAKRYFETDYEVWNNGPKPQNVWSETTADEANVIRQYTLTLLGSDKKKQVKELDKLSPDILPFAVITNYLQGNTNPSTNGLALLQSRVVKQPDGSYWPEGKYDRFGSKDASTALAIRAILIAHGDRDLASEGARYLVRNRHYDYWSNTFATAQVIRALTDLSKTGSESSPDYNYTVSLDAKQITSGNVTSKLEKDVTLPVKGLKDGSQITLTKDGEGQLYSTLVAKEWRTDTNAKAVEHGLKVTREYVNAKGYEYSLGVGDMVEVRLIVSGLDTKNQYAVIEDQLPAGLVPVNENFENEQYGQPTQYQYGVSDREVTENGMVLSLWQIEGGEHTYTYRARVVSEGTFLTPPAFAALMYNPEIYGRTEAQTVQIDKEAKIIPGRLIKKETENVASDKKAVTIGTVLVILIALLVVLFKKRPDLWIRVREKTHHIFARFRKSDRMNQIKPPSDPTPTPPEDTIEE